MAIDLSPAWTDRFAPAPLRLVQEFLNAPMDEPTEDELRTAEAIRRDAAAGDAQAALAVRYGIGQQRVSAILRGARLVAISTVDGDVVSAPTLGSPASTGAWLAAHGFDNVSSVSERDHEHVRELRRLLLALCLANNGEPLPPDVLPALDQLAGASPMVVRFGSGESPALESAAPGIDRFIAGVVSAVYDAMRDGTWRRLKSCPGDHCQHVFYDTSRNRTSTWCSMAICGNRTKVRNYQERVRATRSGRP